MKFTYISYDQAVIEIMADENKEEENEFTCPLCLETDNNPHSLHEVTTNSGNKVNHCICTKCSDTYRKYFSMCCICRADL